MTPMHYDLIIKNGKILDGTGNPWYYSDVGVKGDTIASIGKIDGKSEKVIDVKGHLVAPGFIDIHSHSDMPILIDPMAQSKIRQGVTTEVIGQCGNSAAPMYDSYREYRNTYNRNMVPDDFQFDWTTMKSYMERLENQGSAVNIAPVVGHGTVRANVLGYENRKPSEEELEAMRGHVRDAMEDGAWGMSTGLIYPPSVYGKKPEITELAKVVAEYGGVYFSHIRGEGDTLLDAVSEACEIGKDSGTPVQIAHFKASGVKNWGKSRESLALVEKYRDMGVEVTFDQYPYIASSTGLTALLPHWAHEGGAAEMLGVLRDPVKVIKIKSELRLNYGWDKILVTSAKNNPQYNGKHIQDISEMMGLDPFDAYVQLLILENTQVPSVMFGMHEDDVRRVMRSPYGMIGSDGSAINPSGIWEKTVPHPRLYGTFPRVIGYYTREGVVSLQEAVRKMTGAPAQKLGLKDRGFLMEGYKADITIFHPEEVKDVATFTDPQQYAAGIPYVLVNGKVVVEKGEHNRVLPGKALRKR
jgi:N-acyl-D-amino-acid deacylase